MFFITFMLCLSIASCGRVALSVALIFGLLQVYRGDVYSIVRSSLQRDHKYCSVDSEFGWLQYTATVLEPTKISFSCFRLSRRFSSCSVWLHTGYSCSAGAATVPVSTFGTSYLPRCSSHSCCICLSSRGSTCSGRSSRSNRYVLDASSGVCVSRYFGGYGFSA